MMRKFMIAVWMMTAVTCLAQQVDFKSLDKLAAKAKSKTEIDMDDAMVKSAAGFLNDQKKDESAAKESAKKLQGMYLRSFEFDQKDAYKMDDLKPLFDQLKAPNWKRFLREQEDGEETQIWMHYTNGVGDGMLLISAEEGEVTVINAVGTQNLADLAVIGTLKSFPRP
jgi:hypothetical protein